MPDWYKRIAEALGHRYHLKKELGGGAVATVYLADDLKHDRQVAVKVLRPDVTDAIAWDRFLQEIDVATKLSHPNIVPVFDSGRANGVLFYVMPFQEGESLRDRLEREGQLSLAEAVALAREVAEALDYAHNHGIIHRDIKPANILLSGGHALVADFGVARAVTNSARDRLTAEGLTLGTPAYMSPEQAAGLENITPKSDLYSLGCVLYEMLGGEPPFPGRTPQSVIARHISEPPLPLGALRQGIPKALEKVVKKALAKSPADRFRSAGELQQRLSDPHLLDEDEEEGRLGRRRKLIRAALWIPAFLVAAGGFWTWREYRPPPLDPNKVLVFPLSDRGGGGANGSDAALWIVSTLEHADPIRPIDAWDRLDPQQRGNIDLLSHEQATEIAKASGAGHFLTGAINRSGDSLGVSLVLHSTRGDSIVARESAFDLMAPEAVTQLGLRATVSLLPRIIDPGREVDLTALTERDPTAIIQWVQGEREYRLGHFEEALGSYEVAIAKDSLLAFAALKGGQAASWVKDFERAGTLLDLALRHADVLPLRHQYLARGLSHFNESHADSAEHYLRMATREDPEWSEAWMALAEVHHHLFPSDLVVDSSDLAAFHRAMELDPGFYPPLIHLTEDAIRKGHLETAADFLRRMEEGGSSTDQTWKFGLMLGCVAEGPDEEVWQEAARLDHTATLDAGLTLATGGYQAPCAKAALRALLLTPDIPRNIAWGATVALQGLLVAESRYPEALTVLDSALAQGYGEAQFHMLIGALAGAPWEERAEEIQAYVEGRFGAEYKGMTPTSLWLVGSWHAFRGEAEKLSVALRELRRRSESGDVRAHRYSQVLGAQAVLLAGDTTTAIDRLNRVLPEGSKTELGWNVAAPLPYRHLTLARALLATGHPREALRAASIFDHAEPVVFLAFLPRSLEIRLEASEALGRSEEATSYRERLFLLGHSTAELDP